MVPPTNMVKKDKGVVDHNDGGEAESESGIVVPPHKCSNFSLAVMLTARQVCPVVEGHDAAGSASLTELGPPELVRRGDDDEPSKFPWNQSSSKGWGGSKDNVNLPSSFLLHLLEPYRAPASPSSSSSPVAAPLQKNISCIQPSVRPELFAIAALSLTGRHRRRHHQLPTAVLHTCLTVGLTRTRLATHEEKEGRGGGGDR
ncbi:Os02g0710600 [Oryza sativa Japonica Group]|uniref:Os02g0710600 protein n=1 Tax=Oryza sativa subsp. japonica TaxID=39947 RepID=A0A0P0VNL3_ORYSJ|nr:Os02g0710600 [Oryza sativa Japonica Group]